MALPQAKQDATDARLAALTMPSGGAWITQIREAARSRLADMGLPGRRDEYWRWTNPATLNAPEADTAALHDGESEMLFGEHDRLTLVFTDGVLDTGKSDDLALEGVEIETLEGAGSADIHWARDVYGQLEAAGQSPVARPFAVLNTAYATSGLVIRATGKAARPIHIHHARSEAGADTMVRLVVRVESGAELTILEDGPAAARMNMVMEVDVASTGAFHHVRAQGRAPERRAITHVFARLGQESTFKSFTLTANGALTRNEAVIEFTGDDAAAHVAGACLGDGKDFHHDDTVFVTHGAERCESRQVFKKVLRNGATGIFQGKILVREGAQKTDGYQISQSLLLDEDSTFLAKPELEIYADDVVCSHGSTSGAIDEEGKFYLRSRGIPEDQATDLMTIAFIAEAIAEIEDSSLGEQMLARLEDWLARRRGD
ncbi:SufD family Fe-S cluster assembly protein [Roseicyclus sp. F158]|uniref:SufD family Fe-S cluster assembly protein n=1 Tax=Tropicimonas omnivorans TaxID=3075590 RepID=A0ABU3DGV8_9RHOB|nr:SufD family Fe-S cluster assembly protein [Roseicyclus sp. F158]MDT0682920.1 SufD family Fe-S cluster assembly protein [Roseicyclus sp. F158]